MFFSGVKDNVRLSIIGFIQQVIEDKVREIEQKGKGGPKIHLRFLAVKEIWIETNQKDRLKYLVSKGYLNKLIEQSEKLIEEKSERLRMRGVKDGGIEGGLQFLAIEELCEEKEILLGKIKAEELIKAKHGNCMVACIDDLESKIEIDKTLRNKARKKTGYYIISHGLYREVENKVYHQKRMELLRRSKLEEAKVFTPQRSYKVDPERVTELFETVRNLVIVYLPLNQRVYHALKVIEIDDGSVIAEHLDEANEISLINSHLNDLISENKEIVVDMDEGPRKLTEAELSDISIPLNEAALLVPELLHLEPEYESTVRLDLFIRTLNEVYEKRNLEETRVAFKVKLEKFTGRFSEDLLYHNMILYKSKVGEYHHFLILQGIDSNYVYGPQNRKVPLSYCVNESEEIILVTLKIIKDKYFKEEEKLSEKYMKNIDMVYRYKPYKFQ